jgi:hypothetical protein
MATLNNQMVCETYETLRKIALINRNWATLFSDKSTCDLRRNPKATPDMRVLSHK